MYNHAPSYISECRVTCDQSNVDPEEAMSILVRGGNYGRFALEKTMGNFLQGENYGRFAPEEIIDDWATAFVHVGVAHTSNALSVYKSRHFKCLELNRPLADAKCEPGRF